MEEQLYYDLYQYLSTSVLPEEYDEQQQQRLVHLSKHYFIENDKLYRKSKNNLMQRVITPKHIETILYNLHKDMTGAHLGVETTYEKVKERYYWPKMYDLI